MLSIIIPTYNSEKTIKKCINSILSLNKINYEIILIDDGSKDKTPIINKHYANNYTNITYLHQNHKGVSAARNKGIHHAHGSWMCSIDSDDFINASNLEKIYNEYAKPHNDIIISNINFNGKSTGLIHSSKKISDINTFLDNNYPLYKKFTIMDNSGKIYNLNTIRKYNITYPIGRTIGEDFIFTLRFLMHTNKNIIQTRINFYNYYIHPSSSVANFDKYQVQNRLAIFQALKNIYNTFNLSKDALNWIKVELSFSILLNALRKPTHNKDDKKQFLSQEKVKLYKLNFIPNNAYRFRTLESHILEFMIRQPSITLLSLFLKFITLIQRFKLFHNI